MTALLTTTKLPKRARAEIDALRKEVDRWKEQALAAASTDPGSTNVMLYGCGTEGWSAR